MSFVIDLSASKNAELEKKVQSEISFFYLLLKNRINLFSLQQCSKPICAKTAENSLESLNFS